MPESTLPQGRELDAMWAKAIGQTITEQEEFDEWEYALAKGSGNIKRMTKQQQKARFWRKVLKADGKLIPRYSSSIAAAWQVKAEMVKRKWSFSMHHAVDGLLTATFSKGRYHDAHKVYPKSEGMQAVGPTSAVRRCGRRGWRVTQHKTKEGVPLDVDGIPMDRLNFSRSPRTYDLGNGPIRQG